MPLPIHSLFSLSFSPTLTLSSPKPIQNLTPKHKRTLTVRCISQINPKSNQEPESPPLVNALKHCVDQKPATFHFPGHNRGLAAPKTLSQLIGISPFAHDLPELPELETPLVQAQRQAAELFGASETLFLVGGTTCGIQSAIMATCCPGDVLILPRNSHSSAFSAMILSGAVPSYIFPEFNPYWDFAAGIDSSQVSIAIEKVAEKGRKPAAVFVTSPTYHGVCSDLRDISRVCHSWGIPLIVDEAHGAHLRFHPRMPESALQQGADLAVQSTHKVLFSLTQSSMLHVSGDLVDRDRIRSCHRTLQTTSPSYLLLASLDAARHQLGENSETVFEEALEMALEAKERIRGFAGVSVLDSSSFLNFPVIDPLRVTVGFSDLGLSGYEADEILTEDHGIVCELVGTKSITFAFNLGTSKDHVERLVSGIQHVVSSAESNGRDLREENRSVSAPFTDFTMTLTPRDAFFSRKRRVSISECIGEVCGELICPYPPGIPVLIPGETITVKALDYLLDVKSKGALINGASDTQLSSILICIS